MDYPNPIIFVHGIQGSWLKNQYLVDYQDEIYWSGLIKRKFDKLHLSHIDAFIDRDIDNFIFPHQAIAFVYESIVEELRDEVTEQTYVFTYDWRKDNRLSAKRLAKFVELVLRKAKTHALENSKKPVPQKISLVGHSMGGLVIKWYITQILQNRAIDYIDKIITIATPYRGSLKAIEALLPGARNFFGLESKKAMRRASRTLPGVYQLLPSPSWKTAVIDKYSRKYIDIFKEDSWQENLVKKLRKDYGKKYFQTRLDDARNFIKEISKDYKPNIKKKFYCIYGTGSETWKQVEVDTRNSNMYLFHKAIKDKQGDGTVHRKSSVVKAADHFTDKRKLIEIGGQHVQMPKHGDVQDYIVKIFTKIKYLKSFESPV